SCHNANEHCNVVVELDRWIGRRHVSVRGREAGANGREVSDMAGCARAAVNLRLLPGLPPVLCGRMRMQAGRGDVPSPQYDPAMCRSKSHGSGRRCPGCGSYKAAAKANGNRRLAREARRKVVEHLKEQGLVESAAAVLAAPPSVLKEFMEGLGI